MTAILAWANTHQALTALIFGVIGLVYHVLEGVPRLAGFFKVLQGLGVDFPKILEGLGEMVGKNQPPAGGQSSTPPTVKTVPPPPPSKPPMAARIAFALCLVLAGCKAWFPNGVDSVLSDANQACILANALSTDDTIQKVCRIEGDAADVIRVIEAIKQSKAAGAREATATCKP